MSKLSYKRTNVYEKADEQTKQAIFDYAKGYCQFIDEGKTVALGTHEELMDSCDIYREISESQMGGEVE